MSLVSNQALREHFERSGVRPAELAARLGYFTVRQARKGRLEADGGAIYRALGLKEGFAHGKKQRPQSKMRESTALRYCEALGLDPVDIGL